MMHRLKAIALSLVVFFVASCRNAGGTLESLEVERLAISALDEEFDQGYHERYVRRIERDEDGWKVFFDRKGVGIPGDHHLVLIDRDGAATLLRGQ